MITLYTAATGNGYRASVLLEECGLPYRVEAMAFGPDLRTPEFLALNPIGKIPAIVDDDAPGGGTVTIAESLAIALYCVEKSGRLLPATAADRARAMMWAAVVATGLSAAITGIFFARQIDAAAHAGIIAKYQADIAFNLAAIDAALAEKPYFGGSDFSWADAFIAPLALSTLPNFAVDLAPYPHLARWRDTVGARPAVRAGLKVPA